MTDLDEQTLARELQRRPLPAEQPDIAGRSVALGRRMRRRRRGAAVAVFAALSVVVGVALGGGTQFGRLGPGPAATVPAPGTADLSPADLTPGPAPTVDYVHDGAWVRVDGRTVPLADPGSLLTDRGDAFVGFDSGLLAVRDLDQGPAEVLGYSRDDRPPAEVPGVDPRILGGAQPGPDGSVLIPVVGGYAVAHADGSWSVAKHFGDPSAAGALPVVAAKNAVFHAVTSGSTTVARRSALDPKIPVVDNEPLTRPVTSDPANDRIVLADAQGCQQVILHDPWTPSWYTCTWDLKRLASDGRHAVGLSPDLGWAVVDLRTGNSVLVLGKDGTVDPDSFRFDRSGQLNLVVRSDTDQSAIATCTLDRRCWLATPWSPTPYVLIQPNGS